MTVIKEVPGLDGPVRELVYKHVFGNADREVGGVLVGRLPSAGSIPLVTGAIAAASASEQRATLTFTQDSWEHVHRILERDHPRDQIVGWYHSHPGFGIFLSEDDLFIHRNFFSGPSQIALVVDPLNGREGVFVWEDADVAPWYERDTAQPGLGASHAPVDPRTIEPSPVVGPPRTTIVLEARRLPASRPAPTPLLVLALAGVLGILIGVVLWEGVLRDDGSTVPPQPSVPARSVPG